MSEMTESQPNETAGASETASQPDSAEAVRGFDDWTQAELVAAFWRAPKRTWLQLSGILKRREAGDQMPQPIVTVPSPAAYGTTARGNWLGEAASWQVACLALCFAAVVSGVIGASTLLSDYGGRGEAEVLAAGAPFLWLAFGLWLCAELLRHMPQLRDRWREKDNLERAGQFTRTAAMLLALSAVFDFTGAVAAPADALPGYLASAGARIAGGVILWRLISFAMARRESSLILEDALDSGAAVAPIARVGQIGVSQKRIALMAALTLNTLLLWANTSGNSIPQPWFTLWIVNSFGWALLFAPANWHVFDWASARIDAWRRMDWRGDRWVMALFGLVMLLGIGFRMEALDVLPGEMTADHVEKLLDSKAIYDGAHPIYLANNGGREPMQMYIVAFLARLPWFGFDFYTLKFASALEGILALPLIFWLGVELLPQKPRNFRQAFGLAMMTLVAVSYWHVIISRQGLRIPLTLIFACLILIHLARAMRNNQRADYLKAALALGFCLYAYQAARLMPLFIAGGIFCAILLRDISWRERGRYLLNLAILSFVALMVYLPMLHYALEQPDAYWGRLSERMIGSDLASGDQAVSGAQLQTTAHAVLVNLRDSLLMFNWKGNSGWFNGPPDHPVMDTVTGALLILGVAAWLVKMTKSRDPVLWFLPMYIVIMLLPSALSTAFPDANPSNSRSFNVIAGVYAVAALPMTLIAWKLRRMFGKRVGMWLALLFCTIVALLAYSQNRHTYFALYARGYESNTWPHREAGAVLRGFVESDGALGNVFSVGFAHWWDYRAIGIEAGYLDIENDASPIDAFPQKLRRALDRSNRYRLDTNRDLLIFIHVNDAYARERLFEWFPAGRMLRMQSYHPEDRYDLFRAPSQGEGGWVAFLSGTTVARG